MLSGVCAAVHDVERDRSTGPVQCRNRRVATKCARRKAGVGQTEDARDFTGHARPYASFDGPQSPAPQEPVCAPGPNKAQRVYKGPATP